MTGNGITRMFMEARNRCGLNLIEGTTPPTFHEQRSLAERLYSAHGIHTQTLLGHKNASMTEKYHDDRGADWITLAV